MEIKQLRVGLVGLGGVAIPHLDAYRSIAQIEVVAGADPDPERREEISARYGLQVYAGAAEMLEREALDIACVLTPASTHRAVTEIVARHGVHVLCEKPIAVTLEEAEAMLAACEDAQVQFCYGSTYRFLPALMRARELILDGVIGEVRLLSEYVVGGDGVERHQPMGPIHYPHGGPGGGGMGLVDHGVHLIDIFPWLLGEPITAVFGRGNVSGSPPAPEFLLMFFPGGAVGQLLYDDATFSAELPSEGIFSWGSAWTVAGTPLLARRWHAQPVSIRIHGSAGALRVFPYANQLFLTTAQGQEQIPVLDRPTPGNFALQMEAFVADLAQGERTTTGGSDGLRALQVLLAAYESFAAQRVVPVERPDADRVPKDVGIPPPGRHR